MIVPGHPEKEVPTTGADNKTVSQHCHCYVLVLKVIVIKYNGEQNVLTAILVSQHRESSTSKRPL